MNAPKKITVLTHYFDYDNDFSGDYTSVDVFFDKKLVQSYGDYYHEKGDVRAEEFVKGYLMGVGKDIPVVQKQKADYNG